MEITAPGWDVECSITEEPYHLADYDQQQEASSTENIFSNGTVRPNSTYDGPKVVQTVFQTSVILNYTLSDFEHLKGQGAVQVCASSLPCEVIGTDSSTVCLELEDDIQEHGRYSDILKTAMLNTDVSIRYQWNAHASRVLAARSHRPIPLIPPQQVGDLGFYADDG